jgi:hypothetical protein
MSDNEIVQFGCIRCKKTKRTIAADEAAERVMLQVFEAAFGLIQAEGANQGITVSGDLKSKLIKWGVQQSILPADAQKRQKTNEDENEAPH